MTIFSFNTVGEFLESFRQAKNTNRKLSFAEISKRLNYSSERTVGMVYSGKRPVSREMQRRIERYLNMTPKEVSYLDALIEKARLEARAKDTTNVDKKIKHLRPRPNSYQVLSEDTLIQMAKWYFVVIKNIVGTSKKGVSKSEILERIDGGISASEMEAALQVLLDLKFIKQVEGAYLLTSNKYFTTRFDVPSKSVREAHKQMIARAEKAIDEQSLLDREFITKTLIVSADKIAQAKERIRSFTEELSDDLISDPGDDASVYQFSVQFFRQAKSKKISR